MVSVVASRQISASCFATGKAKGEESLTIQATGFNAVRENIRKKGNGFSSVTVIGPGLLQEMKKSVGH